MSLETVVRTLDGAGIRFALIGAVALASRGVSRSTRDIDLLTTDRNVLTKNFWDAAAAAGAMLEIRRGDLDDPLAGVVRVQGDEPIDIVVGKYRWQREIIDRAESISIRGLTLRVPRLPDLILLKLDAGGYKDLDDIRRLLAASANREETATEVEKLLADLPEEMRSHWSRLKAENG